MEKCEIIVINFRIRKMVKRQIFKDSRKYVPNCEICEVERGKICDVVIFVKCRMLQFL